MNKSLRKPALVAASIAIACTEPTPVGPPSVIQKVTPATATTTAGLAIAGGVTVRVVDARGKSVGASRVAFTVTAGDGSVSPHVILSDANGLAHTEWTVGQTAGANALRASIEGVDSTATFTATGTAGSATAVAVTPRTLRLAVGATTGAVTGSVVDKYGNGTGVGATFTSRNTSLVTVNSTTGAVSVVGAGGTSYIVAAGATFLDSTLVIVLKSGDTPCTGITARSNLAIGEVITTGFFDNGICVDATTTGGEYALVPYFSSPLSSAQVGVSLTAFGSKAPGVLNSARPAGSQVAVDAGAGVTGPPGPSGAAFHERIRASELLGMSVAAANARIWYGSPERTAHRAVRSTAVPAVGEQMQINVNSNDFCSNPNVHVGRVAAVTQRSVVVADVSNPPGFTDAEYLSFGVNFDTLVYSLDVTTFGAPTDIDENGGRIILFFTHAVNDAGVGVLGYYYGRDLLPKAGPLGTCPGSNVSEIMYLLVPDAVYSKNYVLTNTVGTAAHEFQHLINAARRLYVNTSAIPTEERWLNEGLSHVAEELMFYRASGLKPRQNIGAELFTAPYAQPYLNFQINNVNRLKEYVKVPESQSPVGTDDSDEDFATRGAIWSYLRYVADQRFSATESTFWSQLVNSNVTGLQNLYGVVGVDARLLMRDWTLSMFLDDLVPGVNAKYQQASWNLRAVISSYAPATVPLSAASAATSLTLKAGGTVFARFGVAANQEAYVVAAGTLGTALPKNVLLALVRTK